MLLSKEKEDEEKNANASIDKETKEAYCSIKALKSPKIKTRQTQTGTILQNQFNNSEKGY